MFIPATFSYGAESGRAKPITHSKAFIPRLPGHRSCGVLSKSEIAFMVGDQVSAVKRHQTVKRERQRTELKQNKPTTHQKDSMSLGKSV